MSRYDPRRRLIGGVGATAAALRFQEGQQVRVNGVGLSRGHAVRKALVCFQYTVLQQCCRHSGAESA